MEFKGTKGKWGCVFNSNKSRAVRNKGGIIATIYKPNRYSGQDERYDNELEEARCNQRLIAAAPELLEALQEIVNGNGAYDTDKLRHASNCIENMKSIAKQAINKALK